MKLHRPAAPLDRWVNVIWLLEQPAGAPAGRPPRELALPTATAELVVNLEGRRTRVFAAADLAQAVDFEGPMLCGVHSRPFAIDTARPARTLGVNFKPGGASVFLPVPAHVLENVHVSLADLLGARARQLEDELHRVAHDAHRLFATMEAFLAGEIRHPPHAAVRDAIGQLARHDARSDAKARPDISTLVDRSGYSHRRFTELFRTTVGLGAKQFSRIARFQQALRQIERNPLVDWQDVVLDCGFYDQAHLIHEFRRHAGLTPTAYLAKRGPRLNHPAP